MEENSLQIEPRIFAYRANDEFMLKAYNSGRDLYATMASEIYKKLYEECLEAYGPEGKERRSNTKKVLLGLLYGRQYRSIGEQCGMSPQEAKKFVEHFFTTFPSVKKYMDNTVRLGRLCGYGTTIEGKRRRLPDLNSQDKFRKAEAERQLINFGIQGSSAEITKRAMQLIHADDWLNKHDCGMVNTIHDEVLVEVPQELEQEAGKRIRQLMIQAADILTSKLPIKCDVVAYETAWYKDEVEVKIS